MWDSAIDDLTIKRINDECMLYNPMEAAVGHATDGKPDNHIRQSTVRWVNPTDVNSAFITHLLWKYVREANRLVFNVDVTDIFDIQYTIYDGAKKGHYDWHFDTFWGNSTCYDRKLSITVQLSDENDYEGGDLIFYNHPDEKQRVTSVRGKGSIIVFDSRVHHEVTPVTKGVRYSLVKWYHGDEPLK